MTEFIMRSMAVSKREPLYREVQVCRCVIAGVPMILVAAAGLLRAVYTDNIPRQVLRKEAWMKISVAEFSREALLSEEVAAALLPLRAGIMQLEEYFSGRRRCFRLPIAPIGTDFQLRVWEALRAIPYGETRSYGQIAEIVGCPQGARAVGMACHANPLLIVTPCHRVVGSTGALTGFAGGLEMKKRLLKLEQPELFV